MLVVYLWGMNIRLLLVFSLCPFAFSSFSTNIRLTIISIMYFFLTSQDIGLFSNGSMQATFSQANERSILKTHKPEYQLPYVQKHHLLCNQEQKKLSEVRISLLLKSCYWLRVPCCWQPMAQGKLPSILGTQAPKCAAVAGLHADEGASQTQVQAVLGFHTASLAECCPSTVYLHLRPVSWVPCKFIKELGQGGLGIKRDGVESVHHPLPHPCLWWG